MGVAACLTVMLNSIHIEELGGSKGLGKGTRKESPPQGLLLRVSPKGFFKSCYPDVYFQHPASQSWILHLICYKILKPNIQIRQISDLLLQKGVIYSHKSQNETVNLNLLCYFTFSLCSRLLTIRAVICWSINTRIVARRAGIAAAGMVHTGFLPSGGTTQPLFSAAVGWNFNGISSFGVLTPNARSTLTIIIMAIRIAKSEITALTCRKMKHLKIIDFL